VLDSHQLPRAATQPGRYIGMAASSTPATSGNGVFTPSPSGRRKVCTAASHRHHRRGAALAQRSHYL